MGFNSMDVIYHLYKVVKPFIKSRRVSVFKKKIKKNCRSVRIWFQFKPNAFNKVTFKALTPVCNVSNRVVYAYCNTSLSNNFSRNAIIWNVNFLVKILESKVVTL